jgi:YHS domain-containing protein
MKNYLILAVFALLAFNGVSQQIFQTSEGAIKGYDPVAYFTDKKPVKGKKQFTYRWQDATWYFASQAHLDLFKASPEKYAPQFGGFCAYGVSRNYKVKIEPEAWTILDDKLYLNYDLDVSKTWNKDPAGYIKKANANWAKLKDEKE